MQAALGDPHFAVRQDQFRVPVGPCCHHLPDELVETTGDGNLPAEEPQTMTQQVLDPRHGQLAQIAQPCSTSLRHPLPVELGQFIEQATGFGKMAGRQGQRGFGRREALTECDQRLMAQEIAGNGGITIAFIVDPGQPTWRA